MQFPHLRGLELRNLRDLTVLVPRLVGLAILVTAGWAFSNPVRLFGWACLLAGLLLLLESSAAERRLRGQPFLPRVWIDWCLLASFLAMAALLFWWAWLFQSWVHLLCGMLFVSGWVEFDLYLRIDRLTDDPDISACVLKSGKENRP